VPGAPVCVKNCNAAGFPMLNSFLCVSKMFQSTSSQLDTTVGSIGVNMGQHPCGTHPTPCRCSEGKGEGVLNVLSTQCICPSCQLSSPQLSSTILNQGCTSQAAHSNPVLLHLLIVILHDDKGIFWWVTQQVPMFGSWIEFRFNCAITSQGRTCI
jgi:hypothetical protein